MKLLKKVGRVKLLKKVGGVKMLKKVGQCRKQKATSCKVKNRVRASPLMVNRVTQILRQKLKWKQELTFRSNLEIREGLQKDSRFGLLLDQGGGAQWLGMRTFSQKQNCF